MKAIPHRTRKNLPPFVPCEHGPSSNVKPPLAISARRRRQRRSNQQHAEGEMRAHRQRRARKDLADAATHVAVGGKRRGCHRPSRGLPCHGSRAFNVHPPCGRKPPAAIMMALAVTGFLGITRREACRAVDAGGLRLAALLLAR